MVHILGASPGNYPAQGWIEVGWDGVYWGRRKHLREFTRIISVVFILQHLLIHTLIFGLQGQIFYVSSAGDMVEAEVICTLPKANCTLQRSNIISSEMVSGVNSNTDLAATLRSDTDGYRVFYHDSTSTIRQIRMYYPNITWGPGVSVISDTNERLTGITTDRGVSLSVYGVDSVGNIKTSTLASNESWQECKFEGSSPCHNFKN